MKRGYFGIGIFNGKNTQNIGTLWRSAAILGADFIFVIGHRYQKQCSDTMKTPRHIPLYTYKDAEDFFNHVPYDCPVVAVAGSIVMADKIKKIDPKEWQGRRCIECVYSPNCTGAGVMKNACRGFEPRVRKDGEQNG